jgi:hypothetical protein
MGPYRLPVPDDEVEGLVTLLNVLHHKICVTDEKPMNMERLKAVAIVADKYDCTSALYYPATTWLEASMAMVTTPGYESLLTVAYQLDSPLVFTKISKKLVFEWTGSFKKLADEGNLDAGILCMNPLIV